MILCIIKFPLIHIGKYSFSPFWIVTIIGALILIIAKLISFNELFELSQKEVVNPIEILVLFFSITLISIALDETGFFRILAFKTAQKAQGNQLKLFIFFYILISFLTIFTSNDIIILAFTPFICAFAKNTKINPLPYLIAEFVAANTWSIMLLIGNPTNIFLSLAFQIDFISYLKIMFLPAVVSGIGVFIIIYFLFRKQLRTKLEFTNIETTNHDKKIMIVSLIHLIICIILMIVSNLINIEIWLICLFVALSCIIVMMFMNRHLLINTIKRLPWNLIPFIISMFIIVLALEKYDALSNVGSLLANISGESKFLNIFVYGFASILGDNVLNNIPMSLAAIKVLSSAPIEAIYAVIIGSNIGAYLTPIGALAGIMWVNILKKEEVKLTFIQFIKFGFILVPIASILALLTLFLVI